MAVIYEGLRLHQGPVISPSYHLHTGVGTKLAYEFHMAVHMMQVKCSTTVSLDKDHHLIAQKSGWG